VVPRIAPLDPPYPADVQLVELIMLAGLYHAVSFATNAIGVQHEAFAPRFPTSPR